MITVKTSVQSYLDAAKRQSPDIPDDCPSFEWVRANFDPNTQLGEVLAALASAPSEIRFEAATFAFKFMLTEIDLDVREHFGFIVVTSPSSLVRRLAWSRLQRASDAGGAELSQEEKSAFAQALRG